MSREAVANSDSPLGYQAEGRFSGSIFTFPVRVFYEDTDAAGIVYYANYLKFIERARTEMLRGIGLNHRSIFNDHKLKFVVRRCVLDYLASARLDDLIEIHTKVVSIKGASLSIEQLVFHQRKKLLEAELKLACVSEFGAPRRLPPILRATLDTLMNR